MYHGGLREGQSLEELIMAAERLDYMYVVMLGYAHNMAYYENLIRQSTARKKLAIHPAVPQRDLFRYVAAADVDVAILRADSKRLNSKYALPNKILESIQAETPVLGTAGAVEIAKVINEYGVGLTCEPREPDNICRQIAYMHDNPDFYRQCKENCKRARQELCWEKESVKMKKAFMRLQV